MTRLATFARRVTKYLLSKTGGATKQALLQRRKILKQAINPASYNNLKRAQKDNFIAPKLKNNRTYTALTKATDFDSNLYNVSVNARPGTDPGNVIERGLIDKRVLRKDRSGNIYKVGKKSLNKAGKARLAQLQANRGIRKNQRAKKLVTEIMDVFKKRVDKNLPKMKRVNSPVSKRLSVSKEVRRSTDFRGKGRKPSAELAFTPRRRGAGVLVNAENRGIGGANSERIRRTRVQSDTSRQLLLAPGEAMQPKKFNLSKSLRNRLVWTLENSGSKTKKVRARRVVQSSRNGGKRERFNNPINRSLNISEQSRKSRRVRTGGMPIADLNTKYKFTMPEKAIVRDTNPKIGKRYAGSGGQNDLERAYQRQNRTERPSITRKPIGLLPPARSQEIPGTTDRPLVYYQPIPSKKYEMPKSRTSLQQPPLSPGLLPPLSEQQIKAAAKRSGVDQIKVNISPENPATRSLPKSTTNISTSRSTASNKDRGNTNNIGNTLLSLAGLGSGGYLLAHSINQLNKRRRRRLI